MSRLYDCNKQVFFNAEQFMSYHKALYFKDYDIANKILHSINPSRIKEYDLLIRGYDSTLWKEIREDIITLGTYYKFKCNLSIFDTLIHYDADLSLRYNTLWWYRVIDTSPHDDSFWDGMQLLGKCLMKVIKIIQTNDLKQIKNLETKIYKDINVNSNKETRYS